MARPRVTGAAPVPVVVSSGSVRGAGVVHPPVRPLRYGPARRLRDAFAGLRDGNLDPWRLAALQSRPRGGPFGATRPADVTVDTPRPIAEATGVTAWLDRNGREYAERVQTEFLHAQTWAAPWIDEVIEADAEVARALDDHRRARDRRRALPDEPAAVELRRRGPAEAGDPHSTVEARRRREHRERLERLDAEVRDAEQRFLTARQTSHRLRRQVEHVFRLTVAVGRQLAEYHERRAATYRRAFERRLRRSGLPPTHLDAHPIRTSRTLPEVEWIALAECPWLPPAPDAATVPVDRAPSAR